MVRWRVSWQTKFCSAVVSSKLWIVFRRRTIKQNAWGLKASRPAHIKSAAKLGSEDKEGGRDRYDVHFTRECEGETWESRWSWTCFATTEKYRDLLMQLNFSAIKGQPAMLVELVDFPKEQSDGCWTEFLDNCSEKHARRKRITTYEYHVHIYITVSRLRCDVHQNMWDGLDARKLFQIETSYDSGMKDVRMIGRCSWS